MIDTHSSNLPGQPSSLWLDTTEKTEFPPLQDGITVDVAVIGGGIAGLTAATLLKAAGKTVAVLESRRIIEGVTGYTSAKVTSLHTLIYDRMINRFGIDKARAYADANQSAIEQIAALIQEKQIDCDFHRNEAFTYTENEQEREKFEKEVQAAIKLGLPADLVTETPLPLPVKAAVRFKNQAQFHPRKYLLALARDLPGEGSHIFENTKVTRIDEGEPCQVTTEQGTTLQAGELIIASHFPFNDKLLYATRLQSHRSYVLAVRLNETAPRGMFISTEPTYSMRTYPSPDSDLLLVGGEGHQTGEGGDTQERYRRLEKWARSHFSVQEVEYRWSTQDNRTLDGAPYIGPAAPLSRHTYVATGFAGWGMTNGTVAGMLLRDLILKRENPWADVYDPNRITPAGVPKAFGQIGNTARHFVGDRMTDETTEDVSAGEGKIVDTESGKLALYRAEDGTISTLSPVCTHMGCFVQWNSAEKSWDCPCHGSRFAANGKVLQGPAIYDLEEIDRNPEKRTDKP